MIYIAFTIFLLFIIYHLFNCIESISIIFCIGIKKAQKHNIITNQVNNFGIIILISLSILLASIIGILLDGQILAITTGLPMYMGALKSWRINKFENYTLESDNEND